MDILGKTTTAKLILNWYVRWVSRDFVFNCKVIIHIYSITSLFFFKLSLSIYGPNKAINFEMAIVLRIENQFNWSIKKSYSSENYNEDDSQKNGFDYI